MLSVSCYHGGQLCARQWAGIRRYFAVFSIAEGFFFSISLCFVHPVNSWVKKCFMLMQPNVSVEFLAQVEKKKLAQGPITVLV